MPCVSVKKSQAVRAARRAGGAEEDDSLSACATRIGACRICALSPDGPSLPHEPRPVLRVSSTARLLVAGQAPGIRVHRSGLPFDDPSGERLRAWMGVDRATFYDASRLAIVPMGFCFPGYDEAGGDLPPRPECRRTWHDALLAAMPRLETILAVGRYAQDYHFARLGRALPKAASVSETVSRWRDLADVRPRILPLPHPSWRNSAWLKRHPWFEIELLPELRAEVARLIGPSA